MGLFAFQYAHLFPVVFLWELSTGANYIGWRSGSRDAKKTLSFRIGALGELVLG